VSPGTAGPREAGRFITFEGIEGTGKTTQIERLAARLRRSGVPVVLTREPGGTSLGRELRGLLLRPDPRPMSPDAELLLYVTDRAQHLVEVVEPALARGEVVLCDRYLDATLAYQGYGRGLGVDRVLRLHAHPPLDRRPHRTLVLELEPEEALGRATRRNDAQRVAATEGRFEQERIEFHRRVAAGYRELAAAEPERMRRVDASGDADTVERRVIEQVRDLVPELGERGC